MNAHKLAVLVPSILVAAALATATYQGQAQESMEEGAALAEALSAAPAQEPSDSVTDVTAPLPEELGEGFVGIVERTAPAIEGIATNRGDLINITVDDESLENVVNMFTRMQGINIIATSTTLTGRVTVNLNDVEWQPALSSILAMHNLSLVERMPGSRVYSIIPKSADEPEPMIVETMFLRYTTVPDVAPVVTSMLLPQGSISQFNSRNAIIIRTTASNMSEIKNLIKDIDILSRQVCIETKFLELSDEASKQLGIKWDSLEEFGIGLSAGPFANSKVIERTKSRDDAASRWDRRSNVDTVHKYYDQYNEQYESTEPKFLELPDGSFTVYQELEPTREITDTIDTGQDFIVDSADNFLKTIVESQAAILEFDTLNVVLSALKKTDGVSVVSNPKIIVTSGATNAMFSVGSREPIIKTERTSGTQDSPGDKLTTELDTSINTDYIKQGYLETGVLLHVVPVVKTEDLIEAMITPSIRRVREFKTVGDNSWPVIDVKEIQTTFTLKSGQTVAIGGLTDTADSKQVSKIPLLGDIPLLGKFLFSHTKDVKRQVETIIFVTLSLAEPQLIPDDIGIPEDARLVHKRRIRSRQERIEFQKELETMKKAADMVEPIQGETAQE
jgi:type IV pilus assembly protein PilQ